MRFKWNAPDVQGLIRLALLEDHATSDITTKALIRSHWRVSAQIRSKQGGVVAGLPLAALFFKGVNAACVFVPTVKEGAIVRSSQILARIRGPARAVLTAERPALNALQHLSGIASYTRRQVDRLKVSKAKILDTRKTLPAWRRLEKYAVKCGGGANHRMSLGDAILIKDNHLRISRLARGDWQGDIKKFTRRHPRVPVQIEIQSERDLRETIALRPPRVLLDNLPFPRLKRVVQQLRAALPGVEIEVSGGVRPEELRRLGGLGVERISMGKLTHSAPAFDCSLEITRVDTR